MTRIIKRMKGLIFTYNALSGMQWPNRNTDAFWYCLPNSASYVSSPTQLPVVGTLIPVSLLCTGYMTHGHLLCNAYAANDVQM